MLEIGAEAPAFSVQDPRDETQRLAAGACAPALAVSALGDYRQLALAHIPGGQENARSC